jgi:hypothetical protein
MTFALICTAVILIVIVILLFTLFSPPRNNGRPEF